MPCTNFDARICRAQEQGSDMVEIQDSIWLPLNSSLPEAYPLQAREVLLYFITGNPGLIEFYRTFLTRLSRNINSYQGEALYHIVGSSLGGFSINDSDRQTKLPLSLGNQVVHVETQIQEVVEVLQRRRNNDSVRTEQAPPVRLPVILVGHSVGAYILLELISRRQEAQRDVSSTPRPPGIEIVGGICLFPTVVDIARSPSGRKAAPFATSTYFAPAMQRIVRVLCWILPISILTSLVQRVSGQEPEAARITTAFLRSNHGVLQALYMARHELLEMTHDKWSDDVWSVSSPPSGSLPVIDRPKLYFYWGENDHWISNRTRDSVIVTRARTETTDNSKPHMEIDTRGIPHDFCITPDHSKAVADKVADYVREITKSLF